MTDKKHKKKKPRSVEELTKGFDDFAKRNELKEITKEDFHKVLSKTIGRSQK